jgi:hypothetical protein
MSKLRGNPRRRMLARQAAILKKIHAEHGPAHDDSYLLQQGKVRSSYERLSNIAPTHLRSIAHRSNTRMDGIAPAFFMKNGVLKYQGDK